MEGPVISVLKGYHIIIPLDSYNALLTPGCWWHSLHHQTLCPVMQPQGTGFPPQTDRIMVGDRALIFNGLTLLLQMKLQAEYSASLELGLSRVQTLFK